MKEEELGKILREKCESAPKGDKVLSVHFFGIRYSKQIQDLNPGGVGKVWKATGLKEDLETALRHGVNLGDYVAIKPWLLE